MVDYYLHDLHIKATAGRTAPSAGRQNKQVAKLPLSFPHFHWSKFSFLESNFYNSRTFLYSHNQTCEKADFFDFLNFFSPQIQSLRLNTFWHHTDITRIQKMPFSKSKNIMY